MEKYTFNTKQKKKKHPCVEIERNSTEILGFHK